MGKRPLLAAVTGLTLLCSTFLTTAPVHAQRTRLTRPSEEIHPALKQHLGDLIGEIESLHRPENRLTLYHSSLRGALRVDRERGIDMARRAIDLASLLAGQNLERLRDPTINPAQEEDAKKKESIQFGIYREVLLVLADLNPDDAKKLLFETRARLDDPETEPHRLDLARLEYEIETRVLIGKENDPNTMAEALRRTFEAEQETDFRSVLRRFAAKFPDAAGQEVENLLQKFVHSGSGFPWYNTKFKKIRTFLDIISDQFPSGLRAQSYRQYNPGGLSERSRAAFFVAMGDVSLAVITDAQRQALHSRAARSAATEAFSPFREYAPGIALYANEQARDLARVMAEKPNEDEQNERPPSRKKLPEDTARELTVGEILAAAANATSTGEYNTLIEKAAFLLGQSGSVSDGQELLGRIQSRLLRQTVLEVYVRTFLPSGGSGRVRPPRIRRPAESKQERFSRQLGEAHTYIGEGNTAAAAVSLNEAIQTAGGESPKDLEHFLNLIKVAETFAKFDPFAAESLLSNVIYKMNALLEAAVTLDGFLSENKGTRIEDNEFQLEALPPLTQSLLGVRTAIIALGRRQPESVGTLLSRINRVEIRARLRAEVFSTMATTSGE